MTAGYCLLVVAKAPVPGLAKTRLCPPATPDEAAEVAAAALLDTLEVALSTSDASVVVAMTGDLGAAAHGKELRSLLRETTVITQRGPDFAWRLAYAHADAGRRNPSLPIVQIGMDTPQVTPDGLDAVAELLTGADAALGPAEDGGWWALGLRDPADAAALTEVPMSRADTGERTLAALRAAGLRTATGHTLSDVDTIADALAVAKSLPHSRFGAAVAALASRMGTT
ncbi:glycosyltransferase [Amycolatopsis antarctica]|uniref:Glycosyltransferase n=1 Tax=Amycolatopsis antarctica TaxID=1854586 RepID=A0A263D4R6_9PSEU|nr:DUF2064 domain-containing protein [Amycolatopsis antarctica]OZM73482.1 glycosyltransferase [Amycolatopsis antarctica]